MSASVNWEIHGVQFANCNCIYACPCQFNALPDKGFCEAMAGYRFDRGSYGTVTLDGLSAVAMYKWPGPVHLGNGVMQLIIDEQADALQRDALIRILSGQDTDEMATMWWVFGAMTPTKYPPLFAPVTLDIDMDSRRGSVEVPGLVSMRGEPIRNPVTGDEHRVRIDFPQSFEFRIAEIGSGTSTATGAVVLDLKDSYAQFAEVHLSNKGRLN